MKQIALSAANQFALDEVAAALRGYGLEAWIYKYDTGSPPPQFERAFLICNEQGVVSAGEQTTLMREAIGDELPLILCTSLPTLSDRSLLLECGASDVITPRAWTPPCVAERILGELILAGDVQPSSCGLMQGATQSMRALYHDIEVLAPLDEPILILGETGVGKELVAQELHNRSGRKGQFLPINCPAISRELLPSELFGHEKGAFTNAVQARTGLLAEAGEGTVFLDEIGDLDLESQAKLLRVLEDQRVMPVGSNRWVEIKARLVMATNRDLEQDAGEGKFRGDLLMRLQGFTLSLPPLRERRADLPLLVRHFVEDYNQHYSINLKIPAGTLDCLFRHDWTGNVRELRSAVRKAAAFADKASDYISDQMLLDAVRTRRHRTIRHTVEFDPAVDELRDVVGRAEKQYLRSVLTLEQDNVVAAAKRAGISRSQFYEKLKEAGAKQKKV